MTLTLPRLLWKPSPNYSGRGEQEVRLIVTHDCEGSYEGSIGWFAMADSRVSAHVVLSADGAEATQMVAWRNKAWAVCVFNPISESIEAAGFSAKGLGAPEWAALAGIVAFRLKANSLPCQQATAANDWMGFCQHADLGAAGGGHHDITPNHDIWTTFAELVARAYGEPLPATWEPGGPTPFVPNPEGPRNDIVPGTLEWVQMELNALGLAKPPLVIDGKMGHETEMAVRAFQASAVLTIDGDPGPLTVAALTKPSPPARVAITE
jgi:hypothetical protein